MIRLLSRWLIPDRDNVSSPAVRRAYGTLCGAVGIALNILLFIGKFFAGQLSGSIAVTADAFNNLSDAGSSAVTLLGFRLAGKKPDTDHPFGHGRIEYISGLIVAGLILLMGVELAKSSFDKILHPEAVTFSLMAIAIMAASVCVKVYMWLYNRAVGRKIKSAAMEATATDSLSDTVSTLAVLLAMLIGKWTGLAVDGYVGLVVALFILFSAYKAAKETLSPLLGQAPDPALVQQIRDIVLSNDTVLGVHDLVVHDYGPGRLMITLHAEVPAHGDIMAMHDVIDNIEKELMERLHCHAVIHMERERLGNALRLAAHSGSGKLHRRARRVELLHAIRHAMFREIRLHAIDRHRFPPMSKAPWGTAMLAHWINEFRQNYPARAQFCRKKSIQWMRQRRKPLGLFYTCGNLTESSPYCKRNRWQRAAKRTRIDGEEQGRFDMGDGAAWGLSSAS